MAALELEPPAGPAEPPQTPSGAEVLLVMGIPGSGKSRLTADLEGYERLNRDDRGGSLAALARELDRRLGEGVERLVLAFCHDHGVDPARSVLVGTTSRHRALATAVGARFTSPG